MQGEVKKKLQEKNTSLILDTKNTEFMDYKESSDWVKGHSGHGDIMTHQLKNLTGSKERNWECPLRSFI